MAKSNIKKKSNGCGLLVLIGCCFAAVFAYNWHFKNRNYFKKYTDFGIELPTNFSIHGIDVSHHNGTINWQMVKNVNVSGIKIGFAFIKATQGNNFVDHQFENNWQQTKKVNITRGAYHYFTENCSGIEQAAHFIKTVGAILPGDLPPVLDIEENKIWNKAELNKQALDFLEALEKHYNVKPILYTYASFFQEKMDEGFNAYPLWIAHYNEKHAPNINRNWIIWQHNEHGTVSGINEDVDFNAFKGDWNKFRQYLK